MQYLLGVLILGLLPILGFMVGVRMAQHSNGLPKAERKELNRLRDFEADALNLAHEHLAYGDPLATLIIDLRRKQIEP